MPGGAPDIGWQTVTCHTSQHKAWDTGKITALTHARLQHTAPHGYAADQSGTILVEADSAGPQSAIYEEGICWTESYTAVRAHSVFSMLLQVWVGVQGLGLGFIHTRGLIDVDTVHIHIAVT